MDTDADLVASTLAGDRAAFAAIYDRYADRLHDFTYSVLRDRDEAADATHDTFLIAAERLGQLRDRSKLRAWLYAIARHEALRRARTLGRVRATAADDLEVASAEPSPEATVDRAETIATVWEAAAGLSARDRALLDLHVRQGLQGQALGDAMGISAHHADVLMSRLRDQVERSIGALLVARQGRRDCPELQALLADWDGTFSPLWRKRVARHVDGCDRCSQQRATLLQPLAAFAAIGVVPAPVALRARTLGDLGVGGAGSTLSTSGGWHGKGRGDGFPPWAFRGTRRAACRCSSQRRSRPCSSSPWRWASCSSPGARRRTSRRCPRRRSSPDRGRCSRGARRRTPAAVDHRRPGPVSNRRPPPRSRRRARPP
jgi:RNA polymerase sigma factor (sigma-70 family)